VKSLVRFHRLIGTRVVGCLCAAAILLCLSIAAGADPVPLPRAHAHNDYAHTRPLFDALDHGFCSVEADIYLRPEGLLIGHDAKDLQPGRTLEKLYLDPLRERSDRNRNRTPSYQLIV
jgi:hypothetical protein